MLPEMRGLQQTEVPKLQGDRPVRRQSHQLRAPCKNFRTYQSWPAAEAPAVWQRFCDFAAGSATAWTVKHWAATMEQNSCGDCHLHLMLQFTAALDSGSVRFIFEGVRPNASPNDYLVCRKKIQQSVDRGMFYLVVQLAWQRTTLPAGA